jgi:hypothetical protein
MTCEDKVLNSWVACGCQGPIQVWVTDDARAIFIRQRCYSTAKKARTRRRSGVAMAPW